MSERVGYPSITAGFRALLRVRTLSYTGTRTVSPLWVFDRFPSPPRYPRSYESNVTRSPRRLKKNNKRDASSSSSSWAGREGRPVFYSYSDSLGAARQRWFRSILRAAGRGAVVCLSRVSGAVPVPKKFNHVLRGLDDQQIRQDHAEDQRAENGPDGR